VSGEGAFVDLSKEPRTLDEAGGRAMRIAGAVGLLGAIASVVLALTTEGGWTRFLASYLVSFAFVLSIGLGALFFVLLQHLTRSGWSVVLRRLAEGVAGVLPLLLLLAVPVLAGVGHLYGWAHHEEGHDLGAKGVWLNAPFFTVRIAVYFAAWIFLAARFRTLSARQDESGDPALSLSMERWSAPGMLLFGVTVTFAAFDLLMSLDPHWFSTIFGVYYFSGAAVAIFALLPILALLLQKSGRLGKTITDEHYHDLGKQLFGYVVFWAYIAFSQYMLIGYADIPEETVWYHRREAGGWDMVGLALLLGHFVVPFLALIARRPKRRRAVLAGMAAWILAMHWLDLYWVVLPELSPTVSFHWLDLTCLLGVGGLAAAFVADRLRGRSLIPEKDPRLAESLAFENL
jgi:hypothetical protein